MSKSIAERIEALEGPCRSMDAEIAVSVLDMERDGDTFFGKDEDYVLERDYYSLDGSARELPHYTASLDAAMTLVPDTTDVSLGRVWCSHRFAHITDGENTWSGKATTEALALCAAALRAQEAHNG